jgi:serine protease Do
LAIVACAQSGLAQAQRDSTAAVAQLERTVQDTIARVESSVVAISRSMRQKPEATQADPVDAFGSLRAPIAADASTPVVGAGIVIDSVGLVLTQYLSVREGDQHFITTTDRLTYPATIRAADARSGLAVLAIDTTSKPNAANPAPASTPTPKAGSFRAIPLGDADTLRKGQFVIAIGNPFAIKRDGQPTASWGIVTNLSQKAPPGTNFNDAPGPGRDYRTTLHHLGTLIQTDAKLGWSAGGGALVNLRGELVGLTTTAATIAGHEQPAGYAIPMNAAFRRIIDALKAGREVEYGMMGVGFGQQVLETPTGRNARLSLLQVYPGTPAARAGLVAGDAVTRVNDRPVNDVDDVQLAISLLPPNTTTTVEYTRNGQPATARLVLAKLATSGKNIVTAHSRGWRGMRVDFATALNAVELAQATASGALDPLGCVLVTDVEEGSDAWNAGVRKGVFVSHVGKKRVTTPAEFHAATEEVRSDAFDIRLTRPVDKGG